MPSKLGLLYSTLSEEALTFGAVARVAARSRRLVSSAVGRRAGTSSFAGFARATSDSKYIKYIVRKLVLRGFRRYAGRLVDPSGWGAIELRNWLVQNTRGKTRPYYGLFT